MKTVLAIINALVGIYFALSGILLWFAFKYPHLPADDSHIIWGEEIPTAMWLANTDDMPYAALLLALLLLANAYYLFKMRRRI